ncbi:neurogenic locus Notch protein-like [Centruroides sculpturatus]|uniref:neurogenic locus Notch protein-like n=1 Tax=Centruroides sculpturatus TaxID=218467 RepID=UPI000C6E5A5D|nr:neurogenic locus Notch protein-like [Centruroides sculpturatus]
MRHRLWFRLCILVQLAVYGSQVVQALISCSPNPCKNGASCVSNPRGESYCNCPPMYVGEYCQHLNPCHTGPGPRCQNGGTCNVQMSVTSGPAFSCSCPVGYSASLCEIAVPNSCDSDPCQNGGTCALITLDNYTCTCAAGYRGHHCQLVDHCASQPCRNGATCHSVLDTYRCTCAKGYTGSQCTNDIDECQHNPCVHGKCVNAVGSYRCICQVGYTGQNCESLYIPCDPSPCENGGSCQPIDSLNYQCSCAPGFSGTNCEINIDDCPGNLCQNGATCNDGINSYTCHCPSTYTGQYCSKDVDECAMRPNVCKNGATCTNTVGGFSCICVNGWTGPDCSENIDDCAVAACFNGATCHDRVGSFYCQCAPGKTGLLCHLDDACASNPCHEGAICDTSPIDGTYICSCPGGFKGVECTVDVDECAEVVLLGSPCEHGGSCVNTPGSFQCNCTKGFTGPRCEININECDSNPCQNDGTCLDERGGFRCVCMPGYTGTHCEIDIDECMPNPCLNVGICTDLINGFKCLCNIGFSGKKCEINEDDCLSHPCQNRGTCTDGIASYTCDCPPGFTGNNCENNINDCQSSPCHHGECIDGTNSFTCNCHPGYTGFLCQTQINECISNPCQHGGFCEDLINGYQCRCLSGTSGPNCEYNENECSSNPCRNGALCIDGINSYNCKCLSGFTGIHCETNIDDCASNPCFNGGICTDLIDGFRCDCPRGYYDARCLSDVNECASNPCQNGGTCEDEVNRFICHCKEGYGGHRCELDIDECQSNPCQHGGSCFDALASYSCNCVLGYTGKNCETNVDDCSSNPCLNDGSCIDLVNAYQCVCEVPFTGRNCEVELDPCSPNKCRNGAKCIPSSNYLDFACTCELGYTGRLCDEDIDECAISSPCRNGATCVNINGSYSCLCSLGYEGRDCLINTDDCASFPCQNGGTCLDGIGEYNCLCIDGFGGKHCETDVNECASDPCQNGATCNDYVNSYTCTCPLGFSGTNCQTNDEDCTSSSCMNGGTCIDGINNYTCQCTPGYTGSNCQYHINECDSQPCQNGATCVDHVGYFICHCPFGYKGLRCETFVDWCSTNPCMNGATCKQINNTYRCTCKPGWTGMLCDVSMVSCVDAAAQKGIELHELCKNEGTCENIGNSHHCICADGYEGSYCQNEINECISQPCQNGARCNDLIGQYTCDCLPGFQGLNCEFNINDCDPNPCRNGGTCHDLINKFVCSCPHGTLGILCEIDVNDCFEGACHHGGTCLDKVGNYECKCPPGFVGPRCEGDVNECLSNPCNHFGTQDCVQLINDYRCDCKNGFMGRHCEIEVNFCESNPCLNGGVCRSKSKSHFCICADGFWGDNCGLTNTTCASNPCQNGGQCRPNKSGYVCTCPVGIGGKHCEKDILNECLSSPCLNGGSCFDAIGKFECECPPTWNGLKCEAFDSNFKGGLGISIPKTPKLQFPTEDDKKKCEIEQCRKKAGNRECNEECNNYACSFDAGDCSLGINPWANCSAAISCWDVFKNGKCDMDCNNMDCLYDGFDCTQQLLPCNEQYDTYCLKNYGNGYCDFGCNNEECNWDGLDCEPDPPMLADGSLNIILMIDPEVFRNNSVAFLREIGYHLRTNVRVKNDENGFPMIYLWKPTKDHHYGASVGTQVMLEIDNRKCLKSKKGECFQTASKAAQFLAAAHTRRDLRTNFDIEEISGDSDYGSSKGIDAAYPNMVYIVIGIIVIVLLGLLIGVLITTQRKRARGITWFPEGFFRANSSQRRRSRRRGPDGQEMRNLNKQPSTNRVDVNDNTAVPPPDNGLAWNDDDIDHPPLKKMKSEKSSKITYNNDTHSTSVSAEYDSDPRQWTQQHLDAADVRNPDIVALTPPQGEGDLEAGNANVDVQGPGGLTPLMLASFRGGGLDNGEEVEDEDGSVSMIQDLLMQGAKINMTTERTGETSLHLAARYARADAAKRLLDAGADANAPDNTGRTPLHAAVAADAQGVFQILLRNRATNLNARMRDGTTPLILAARLAIEGMVEDLINAEVDINAADDHGKTPLHWAAAVNNVDAVRVLLAHGANRDPQNNKEETPLFLAAREGSYHAAKILLEHFANREITDHMDRLPRDVALERMHHDIVRLLDDYVLPSPQITMVPNGPMGATSPTVSVSGSTKSKTKKRAKINNMNALARDNNEPVSPVNENAMRRKASVKKRKEPISMTGLDGSMSLSPVNSLESPHATVCIDSGSPTIDNSLYNGHSLTHINLDNCTTHLLSIKQPPAYEDCVKNVPQVYRALGGMEMTGQLYIKSGGLMVPLQTTQSIKPQPRQIPNSMGSAHIPNSLPYTVSTPIKQCPALPTSPTHMAAMRAAHQQKTNQLQHSANIPTSYDYQNANADLQHIVGVAGMKTSVPSMTPNNQQVVYSHPYHYPTPPSQHSQSGSESTPQHYLHPPETYLTPSPESPGQWSSSSPHSAQSDWSEGISSPIGPSNLQMAPPADPGQSQMHQHQQSTPSSQSQQSSQNNQSQAEAVFIFKTGIELHELCKNEGTCENIGNSHHCICADGYEGSYCQNEINECISQPCQNGARCNDLIGQYTCDCLPGFQGLNCEFNINDCDPNPCRNGGTCHDLINKFVCSCPHGTLGILCEIDVNDCFEGACHHGGTCLDKVGNYECKCPPGFVGPRCEGDVNECLSNPCNHFGTQDCVQLINDYRCDCKNGFMGRHCEIEVNFCESNPCLNGGVCRSKSKSHFCICADGFWGDNCGLTNTTCASNPCQNGGQCRPNKSGYVCTCPVGIGGKHCEKDILNECLSSPCLNGGSCFDAIGKFECECPPTWNGLKCEAFDSNFKGGLGISIPKTPKLQFPTEDDKKKCEIEQCRKKAGNRECNEECNNYACSFDAGDCSLGINPWANCSAAISCWDVFKNGKCDMDCNNMDCLYDGFDCTQQLLPCNEQYDTYCLKNYGNGYCDFGCNNEECNWDGLDCEPDPPMLADGSLNIILMIDPEVFRNNSVAFLREIGYHLRTNVRVKNDENGFPMIYLWKPTKDHHYGASVGTQVMLEIDNRKCLKSKKGECFQTASKAAQFLAAAHTRRDLRTNFDIEEISGDSDYGSSKGIDAAYPNMVYIVIGIIVIVLLGLLIGVLITTQRKRARGITWFPEGFFRANSSQRRRSRRRGPDGQEMRNLNKQPSTNRVDVNDNTAVPPPDNGLAWNDDDIDHPPLKKMKSEKSSKITYNNDTHSTSVSAEYDSDPRQWTQQHLDAADVRNPDIVALTPPQGEGDLEAGNANVDVQGPGGLTPLMLASFRGGGLDNGEEVEDEDGSVSMIQDLLMQGAKINMTTERTGETSLHLAARYARADAAKRLLDAGADANAPDNTGRTPLHAAVAADAQGVFQILLRNRATNLNARMRDGTTPLILAARLAIEGMVEDLINAEVDINAADDHGKTPLHWAAAVNNVDAVRVLLAHGANRDPQNNKEETPLFLAAREGSYHAAKILLEHFANREITDHMDRLPRDVALERMHHDIVRLLDDYVLPSPQITMVPNGPMGATSPTVSVSGSTKSKTKKRAKINNMNALARDNNEPVSPVNENAMRRKASVKKRKEPISMTGLDGSMSLSPVNSLESPHATVCIDSGSPTIDNSLYNGHSLTHINLDNCTTHLLSIKQPPAYEDCVKNVPQVYRALGGMEMTGQLYIKSGGLMVPLQTTQSIKPQPRQIPNSMGSAHIPNSLPYTVSTPIKQCPALPTSPTHMAAMRAAHQQKTNQLQHSANIPTSYDYQNANADLQHIVGVAGMKTSVPSMTPNNQQVVYSHPYHYPTPPSQHSQSGSESTPQHYLHPPETYLTPSPESPGQWSSSSPHSAQSDWSEGISSPIGPSNLQMAPPADPGQSQMHQHQQSTPSSQSQQSSQNNQSQAEAVFI